MLRYVPWKYRLGARTTIVGWWRWVVTAIGQRESDRNGKIAFWDLNSCKEPSCVRQIMLKYAHELRWNLTEIGCGGKDNITHVWSFRKGNSTTYPTMMELTVHLWIYLIRVENKIHPKTVFELHLWHILYLSSFIRPVEHDFSVCIKIMWRVETHVAELNGLYLTALRSKNITD